MFAAKTIRQRGVYWRSDGISYHRCGTCLRARACPAKCLPTIRSFAINIQSKNAELCSWSVCLISNHQEPNIVTRRGGSNMFAVVRFHPTTLVPSYTPIRPSYNPYDKFSQRMFPHSLSIQCIKATVPGAKLRPLDFLCPPCSTEYRVVQDGSCRTLPIDSF